MQQDRGAAEVRGPGCCQAKEAAFETHVWGLFFIERLVSIGTFNGLGPCSDQQRHFGSHKMLHMYCRAGVKCLPILSIKQLRLQRMLGIAAFRVQTDKSALQRCVHCKRSTSGSQRSFAAKEASLKRRVCNDCNVMQDGLRCAFGGIVAVIEGGCRVLQGDVSRHSAREEPSSLCISFQVNVNMSLLCIAMLFQTRPGSRRFVNVVIEYVIEFGKAGIATSSVIVGADVHMGAVVNVNF